jgi:hypothetical protein
MLFNTLANLRALIGLDPLQAQHMLDRLIDYLRATLNASRSPAHAVSAEFARLQDYLALMQIRMGSRLTVQFELAPDAAMVSMPPLLLQPLVENAIKHGLEPHRPGGLLRVSAQRDGSLLRLRVEDSGAGLAAAQVFAARERGVVMRTSSAVTELIIEDGEVLGVVVKDAVLVGVTVLVGVGKPEPVGESVGVPVSETDAPGDGVDVGVADDDVVAVGVGAMHETSVTAPASPGVARPPPPTNVVVPPYVIDALTKLEPPPPAAGTYDVHPAAPPPPPQ